jgi:hypothetical protein
MPALEAHLVLSGIIEVGVIAKAGAQVKPKLRERNLRMLGRHL